MAPDPVLGIPESNEYAGTVNVYFICDLQIQHSPACKQLSEYGMLTTSEGTGTGEVTTGREHRALTAATQSLLPCT